MKTQSITTTRPAAITGEATVLDRAEFARLIRKAGHLRVSLFVEDRNAVASCSSMCAGFQVPAKQAVEKLLRCDFDAFEWLTHKDGTPYLWHYAAPIHVQLRRRREFLAVRVRDTEARLARYESKIANGLGDQWDVQARDDYARSLGSDRTELARLEQRIPAALHELARAA